MAKVKIRMAARLLVNCPEIGNKEKLMRDCEDCPKNKGVNTKSSEVECDHPKSEAKRS